MLTSYKSWQYHNQINGCKTLKQPPEQKIGFGNIDNLQNIDHY
jgi:hypothetical protein